MKLGKEHFRKTAAFCLAVIMVLLLMPAGSLPVNALGNPKDPVTQPAPDLKQTGETVIETVEIELPLPALGAVSFNASGCVDAGATVSYGEGCKVTQSTWHTESGGSPSSFTEGGSYFAKIVVEPLDGYRLADALNVALSEGTAAQVSVSADGSVAVIKSGVITASRYYVWLGDVQVVPSNYGDILGDGSSTFDPDTQTLHLNVFEPKGVHNKFYQIYAWGTDLHLEGKAHLADHLGAICVNKGSLYLNGDFYACGPFRAIAGEEGVFIEGGTVRTSSGSAGIASENRVTVSGGEVLASGYAMGIRSASVLIEGGSVTANGEQYAGISCSGDVTINGGTVSLTGKEYGVRASAGLNIGPDIESVTADGSVKAVETFGTGKILLDSALTIRTPENAVNTGYAILDGDADAALVVIVRTDSLPVFIKQPESTAAITDTTVEFTAEATGSPSYSWEFYSEGQQCWMHLARLIRDIEADSNTLSFTALAEYNGLRIRCVAYYPSGTLNSREVTLTVQTNGGWVKSESGWRYLNPDGTYTKGSWKQIGGKWYHFNADGFMQTGWVQISGKWYYLNTSGVMQTGWVQVSGKWYYLNASGVMQTGWQKISNVWYYFNAGGDMATGWRTINGKTYYFKENGAMAAGEWCKGYWLNTDGTWTYPYKATWRQNSKGWWYGDESGWYAKNQTVKIDGKMYTFDAAGYLK